MKTKKPFFAATLLLTVNFLLLTLNSNAQAPNYLWAKSAGGTGTDQTYSITVDANGNTYVAGWFNSSSISFGSTTLTNDSTGGGTDDMFIVKYDASGNVLWAKSAGGTNSDLPYSITVDANGNTYVTGYFNSASITFGATTLTNDSSDTSDMFIVKYDALGNVLWAKKSAGGTHIVTAYSVTVDANGNAYVAGYFTSASISFGAITLTQSSSSGADMFIVKYDASGNPLWAKNARVIEPLSGVGCYACHVYLRPISVTVDANRNTLVAGYFNTASVSFGSTTLTNMSNDSTADMFIVKYDASGNPLWAKSAGGTKDDVASSLTVDANGNTYVAGSFVSSSISFGATTLTNDSSGTSDMFIVKYDASGNALWAKSAGGTLLESGRSVTVDANGNAYVAGRFFSTSITFGATTLTNDSTGGGTSDMYIVKYDASGNPLWAKSAGGTKDDNGTSVTVDANGNAYVAGYFTSASISFGAITLTNDSTGGGTRDMFIVKLGGTGTGIAENNEATDVSVYPNPTSGVLNLQMSQVERAQILISDVLGNSVYQSNSTSSNFQIDLSAEANGVYFISIQTNEGIVNKKIVIN